MEGDENERVGDQAGGRWINRARLGICGTGGERLVRFKVIVQGCARSGRGYDRGPMLVMTEREWRERSRRFFLKVANKVGLFLLVTFLFMMVLYALIWTMDPIVRSFRSFPFIVAIILGTVFLVTWMLIYLSFLRSVEKGPVIGLYEQGLQATQFLFLPFQEIASIEVIEFGIGPAKEPVVKLRMRHKPRGLAWFTTPQLIMVRTDLLTEEGVEELERRIGARPPEEGPPRLVLYGPRPDR